MQMAKGLILTAMVVTLAVIIIFITKKDADDHKARYGDQPAPTYWSTNFVDTDGLCYKTWKGRHHGAWSGVTKEECPK